MALKLRKNEKGVYELVQDYSVNIVPAQFPSSYGSSERHREDAGQNQNIYFLNGNGKDMKESLVEMIETQKDSYTRFGNSNPESMLKSMVVRETLQSLGYDAGQRFRYLEQAISREVDSGRYQQGMKDESYKFSLMDRLESLPKEQHNFYLSTGMYVEQGNLMREGGYGRVADLMQYVPDKDAA